MYVLTFMYLLSHLCTYCHTLATNIYIYIIVNTINVNMCDTIILNNYTSTINRCIFLNILLFLLFYFYGGGFAFENEEEDDDQDE